MMTVNHVHNNLNEKIIILLLVQNKLKSHSLLKCYAKLAIRIAATKDHIQNQGTLYNHKQYYYKWKDF